MTRRHVCQTLLLLLVAACSGSGSEPTGSNTPPTGTPSGGTATAPLSGVVDIHIDGTNFTPKNVFITAGSTIRWINDSGSLHTITPQNTSQPGVWNRVEFSSSGTVLQQTFTVSGQTYPYRCEFHSPDFTSGMVGSITVQ